MNIISPTAWRSQVAENSTRLAHVYAKFDSTGWGEFTVPDAVMFELAFLEVPSVAYGFALDGDDLVTNRFPRAHGGVYRWVLDTADRIIGAHVFMVVDTLSPAAIADVPTLDPDYNLDHFFGFSGVALKDIQPDLFDE